jgi:hypothetical protein
MNIDIDQSSHDRCHLGACRSHRDKLTAQRTRDL